MRQRIFTFLGILYAATGLILGIIAFIYYFLTPKLEGNHINKHFVNTFIKIDQYQYRYKTLIMYAMILIIVGALILLFIKVLNPSHIPIVAIGLIVISIASIIVIHQVKKIYTVRDFYVVTDEYRVTEYSTTSDGTDADYRVKFSSGYESVFELDEFKKLLDKGEWVRSSREPKKRYYVIHGPHKGAIFPNSDYTVDRRILGTEFK